SASVLSPLILLDALPILPQRSRALRSTAHHRPLTLSEALTLALGLDLVLRDFRQDARCHPSRRRGHVEIGPPDQRHLGLGPLTRLDQLHGVGPVPGQPIP